MFSQFSSVMLGLQKLAVFFHMLDKVCIEILRARKSSAVKLCEMNPKIAMAASTATANKPTPVLASRPRQA